MVAALRDLQFTRFHPIDLPVLARNAPRPPPREIALQGLRLAQTAERMALNILDQGVDLVAYTLIVTAPVLVRGPRSGRPKDLHLTSLCARPLPAASCRTALRRRAALRGLRMR